MAAARERRCRRQVHRLLAGPAGRACKPVERPTLPVDDGQHENVFRVDLERDEVRKLLNTSPPDGNICAFRPWPRGIRAGHGRYPTECFADPLDQPITQSQPTLLMPQRCCAKLSASLRMKGDSHDAG